MSSLMAFEYDNMSKFTDDATSSSGGGMPTSYLLVDNSYNDSLDTSDVTSTSFSHHSSALIRFSEWYEGVHGYISLMVCIFGIAANVMNIVVLTRKGMVTPTNSILTALATADLMTMLSYLPYAIYFHCISSPDPNRNHSQGVKGQSNNKYVINI